MTLLTIKSNVWLRGSWSEKIFSRAITSWEKNQIWSNKHFNWFIITLSFFHHPGAIDDFSFCPRSRSLNNGVITIFYVSLRLIWLDFCGTRRVNVIRKRKHAITKSMIVVCIDKFFSSFFDSVGNRTECHLFHIALISNLHATMTDKTVLFPERFHSS